MCYVERMNERANNSTGNIFLPNSSSQCCTDMTDWTSGADCGERDGVLRPCTGPLASHTMVALPLECMPLSPRGTLGFLKNLEFSAARPFHLGLPASRITRGQTFMLHTFPRLSDCYSNRNQVRDQQSNTCTSTSLGLWASLLITHCLERV